MPKNIGSKLRIIYPVATECKFNYEPFDLVINHEGLGSNHPAEQNLA
jgi:hypothetical protein